MPPSPPAAPLPSPSLSGGIERRLLKAVGELAELPYSSSPRSPSFGGKPHWLSGARGGFLRQVPREQALGTCSSHPAEGSALYGRFSLILGDQGTLYPEVMELLPRPRCAPGNHRFA